MSASATKLTARVQKWRERVAGEEAEIARLLDSMPLAAPRSPRARDIRGSIRLAENRLRTARGRLRDAERAAAEVLEPPTMRVAYVCTVLLRMPADDGKNITPPEVVQWLEEQGIGFIEWHDENLIADEDRTTDDH
jgi:hypothetical protein